MGFLSKIFSKRTSSPGPLDDFWFYPLPRKTISGVPVDELTALTISAYWCAVYRISSSIASLPIQLFHSEGANRIKVENHPLLDLLGGEPCPGVSSITFRETLLGHLLNWGNFFAEIEYDKAFRPIALWILPPNRVEVISTGDIKYRLKYRIRLSSGVHIELPKEKILHIPGMGFDGKVGCSVVSLAKESLGLTKAFEDFGARFFSQGAQTSGIIEYPGKLSDQSFERYQKSILDGIQGLSNAHRLLFLEQGLKYHPTTIPPDAAQFLESRKFQVLEIARWFNIPPQMLMDLDNLSNNNMEETGINFVRYTLQPWLSRIEQALTLQLVYQPGYYFRHNVDGLLRGDIKSRYEAYAIGHQNGFLSANDIRAKEDLNPVPNGDIYLVPMNMIPADKIDGFFEKQFSGSQDSGAKTPVDTARGVRGARLLESPGEPPGEEFFSARFGLIDQFEPLLKHSIDRITQREVKALRGLVKKHFGNRGAGDFLTGVQEFYASMPGLVAQQMAPSFEVYRKSLLGVLQGEIGSEIPPEVLSRFVEQYAEVLGERYTGSSLGQLNQIIQESQITPEPPPEELLTQRIDEWSTKRPEKVAQNESRRFLNAVAATAGLTMGLGLFWRNTGASTCGYCRLLNGRRISSFGESFGRKGQTLSPEGMEPMILKSTFRHPPLHRGCDCMVSFG